MPQNLMFEMAATPTKQSEKSKKTLKSIITKGFLVEKIIRDIKREIVFKEEERDELGDLPSVASGKSDQESRKSSRLVLFPLPVKTGSRNIFFCFFKIPLNWLGRFCFPCDDFR